MNVVDDNVKLLTGRNDQWTTTMVKEKDLVGGGHLKMTLSLGWDGSFGKQTTGCVMDGLSVAEIASTTIDFQ